MFMLRAGKRSVLQVQKLRLGRVLQSNKEQSSQNSTKTPIKWYQCGKNQVYMVVGGMLLLVSGSTVAYAKYDETGEFQKKIEKYLPGSGALFGFFHDSENCEPTTIVDTPKSFTSIIDTSESPCSIEPKSFDVTLSKCRDPLSVCDCETEELPMVSVTSQPKETSSMQFSCHPNTASHSNVQNKLNIKAVANDIDIAQVANALQSQESTAATDAQNTPDDNNTEEFASKGDHQSATAPNDTNTLNDEEVTNNFDFQEVSNEMNAPQRAVIGPELSELEGEDTNSDPEASKDELVEFDVTSAILDDVLSNTAVACADAILLNHAAAKALAIHSSLLRNALDDVQAAPIEKSMQWGDVALSLSEKDKKMEDAEIGFEKAREAIVKLQNVLENVNLDNTLIKRKVLEVEGNCQRLTDDLGGSVRLVDNQMVAAKALSDYQTSIESSKNNLQMNFSLPEGRRVEEWKRQGAQLSSREDLDSLHHLHEEMEGLQSKLAEQEEESAVRLQETIAEVRAETIAKMRNEYEEEMERKLNEAQKVHEIALTEAQSEYESLMQRELRKQASAHAERLAEALTHLDEKAREKYESALQREVDIERSKFEKGLELEKERFELETCALKEQHQVDLNTALAKLQGIKSAVEGRADTEYKVRKALELSLACETLLVSLKYGDNGNPLPLQNHLDVIRDVYGEHPAIDVLSSSLSDMVKERGAYPEETIRRKLSDTMLTCKRVSLVHERRNSLFVYFLSYLKSFLIVSRPATKPPEQIEPSEMECFQIISYANYCLQRGDIEQAVRFLNQLKGEAKMRAERWLQEARLYLETKQSVDALCAISDSIVIGAQLEQ